MASRKEKYPDTETFHYHNQNPKGRITGDCVYRAISYATGIPYNDIVLDFAYMQIETGYCKDDKRVIEAILKKYGWRKCKQPRKSDNTKYTVGDFVKAFSKGTYIIQMAHHLSVVQDGKNIDIWDCVRYGGCVGNYFVEG